MVRIHARLAILIRDERGATAIEYGLVVSLVSLMIVAWATKIGQSVATFLEAAAKALLP